jgi:hypothetical protein
MNASSEPFGLPDTAPEMARRFAVIMAGLGALIARRFVKMPHLSGLTVLLWGRLNRAVRRLHRALQVKADRAGEVRTRGVALPRGRGWIVRELGWEAAAFMGQLELLLADPATRAALAATPGIGRVLRPICRMLGVVMPVVAAPVDVAAEVPPRVWPAAAALGVSGLDGDCVAFATSA